MPRTPIATLGGTPLYPRDHLCVFFRGKNQRDQLLLPFLSEGLRAGHAVLFHAAHGEKETAWSLLGDKGDLELTEPETGHLRDGRFAPAELLESLETWATRKHVSTGRPFGRIAGDMSWAAPILTPALIDELVAEEVSVTGWMRRYPQITVCLYDLDLFGGDLIIPMIKAHPKVWMAGALTENPYYLTPEINPAG
ncbi:MEDS domain-containing protein [Actinophytocola sp.]|uniref:MEDS domain-containing protein n=1 Tax=Actinophytocola sp. TaxID=1872138 RepID=UPI002ED97070